ncbi:MAG: hypothetical protein LBR10_04280 [Prevotellaceae bacterium]|nr:hypothetical protein [Prevotellaceae bacterium]
MTKTTAQYFLLLNPPPRHCRNGALSPSGCLATFSFGVAVIATAQPEVTAPQNKI